MFEQLVQDAIEWIDYGPASAAADLCWARRIHPFGRAVPLMVDPRFAGGQITVIDRGVTADAIRSRLQHSYSVEYIADDLGLNQQIVRQAAEFLTAA